MNLVVGAIAFSDAGTRAFLPVRLAELHSAVIGKARPCELPAEAGYKPAGRTGQRPVFLCKSAAYPRGYGIECALFLNCSPAKSTLAWRLDSSAIFGWMRGCPSSARKRGTLRSLHELREANCFPHPS
jgi:hypothetical protein